MNINDIEIADVLLFSPEKGSFISWAITFLTNAPVSHAAMFYNKEEQSIIEETPPHVSVNFAKKRFKNRKIYVRRLNVDKLPMSNIIEKATNYLNEAEPYDKSGLYMVGLLLIYKKFTPNTLVKKVTIKILKKLSSIIINRIHRHRNPGKLPMVCSQFVAQCYSDAGNKYRLKIENGTLLGNKTMPKNNLNILDEVINIVKNGKRTNLQKLLTQSLEAQEEPSESAEELCQELKEAFESTLKEEKTTSDITDELIKAVSQFAKAQYLLNSSKTEIPNILPSDLNKILQSLKDNANMYIFPGDLLNHCENLKDIGTIE